MGFMDLVILDIFLLTLILSLVGIITLPNLLMLLDDRTDKIRNFLKKNDSLFTFVFIIVFALEQGLLLYLTYKFGNNLEDLKTIIGGFVVIVLTTATIQITILQTKLKYNNEEKIIAKDYLEDREIKYKNAIKRLLNIIKK